VATREFEWDEKKAKENYRKHGIHFAEAAKAFSDPYHITEVDPHEDGDRYRTIGKGDGYLLAFVVHTIIDEDTETEIIRIISARRANPKERRRYGNRKL